MRGITTSLYVHVYVCVDKNDNIKKRRGERRKEKEGEKEEEEDSRSETKNNKELVQTNYRGIPYRKKGIPLGSARRVYKN